MASRHVGVLQQVVEQLDEGFAASPRRRSSRATGAVAVADVPIARTLTIASPSTVRRAGPGAASVVRLACSWNERICSSMERSTLRTSTPSGTVSTTGAKFRMLVTPAATRRSHTCCAAAAGVAITPIDDPRRLITASSSSMCSTVIPPMSSPTTRGRRRAGGDPEAPGGEPAVAGQRVTEVTHADERDGPVLGQAEHAGDLVDRGPTS